MLYICRWPWAENSTSLMVPLLGCLLKIRWGLGEEATGYRCTFERFTYCYLNVGFLNKERQTDWSSIAWFTPHKVSMAGAEPVQTRSCFFVSKVYVEVWELEPFSATFRGRKQQAGLDVEPSGHELALIWDGGAAGGGLVYYAITLALDIGISKIVQSLECSHLLQQVSVVCCI